jgi:hypothetical protein
MLRVISWSVMTGPFPERLEIRQDYSRSLSRGQRPWEPSPTPANIRTLAQRLLGVSPVDTAIACGSITHGGATLAETFRAEELS